jgi:hypothetical protein
MAKSTKQQVQKDYPDFADAVAGLSVADLEARLLSYAKEVEKLSEAKKEKIGARLEDLAAQKKELEGPFKDAAKAIRLKSRYLLMLISEKGGDGIKSDDS